MNRSHVPGLPTVLRFIPEGERPGCRAPGCEAQSSGALEVAVSNLTDRMTIELHFCYDHRDEFLRLDQAQKISWVKHAFGIDEGARS